MEKKLLYITAAVILIFVVLFVSDEIKVNRMVESGENITTEYITENVAVSTESNQTEAITEGIDDTTVDVISETTDISEESSTENTEMLPDMLDGDYDIMYEKAYEILSGMSMEEKIAQLLFVCCRTDDEVNVATKYGVGGVILFDGNFKKKSPESCRKFIDSVQEKAKVNMLIGIDEEGGDVVRVSKYTAYKSTPYKSPQAIYKNYGMQGIYDDAYEKSTFLMEIGINVNIGPVSDVCTNPKDYIFSRSFGKAANETSEYVVSCVNAMNEAGIIGVLKHFPGYGNNVNTHTGVGVDKREYEIFEESEFLPFIAGNEAGAPAVLVSHNIVKCMDPDNPASLSSKVNQILRDEIGFEGIIMTDDIDMKGVANLMKKGESASLQAILAGNDIIICTYYKKAVDTVKKGIENGSLSEEELDEKVMKVLIWKMERGIITE